MRRRSRRCKNLLNSEIVTQESSLNKGAIIENQQDDLDKDKGIVKYSSNIITNNNSKLETSETKDNNNQSDLNSIKISKSKHIPRKSIDKQALELNKDKWNRINNEPSDLNPNENSKSILNPQEPIDKNQLVLKTDKRIKNNKEPSDLNQNNNPKSKHEPQESIEKHQSELNTDQAIKNNKEPSDLNQNNNLKSNHEPLESINKHQLEVNTDKGIKNNKEPSDYKPNNTDATNLNPSKLDSTDTNEIKIARIYCNICKITLNFNSLVYNSHIKENHPNPEKFEIKVQANTVLIDYVSKPQIKSVHLGIKCKSCHNYFKNIMSLSLHNKKTNYKCHICGIQFIKCQLLVAHINLSHYRDLTIREVNLKNPPPLVSCTKSSNSVRYSTNPQQSLLKPKEIIYKEIYKTTNQRSLLKSNIHVKNTHNRDSLRIAVLKKLNKIAQNNFNSQNHTSDETTINSRSLLKKNVTVENGNNNSNTEPSLAEYVTLNDKLFVKANLNSNSESLLVDHRKVQNKSKIKHFKCTICLEDYPSNTALHDHMGQNHLVSSVNPVLDIVCKQCKNTIDGPLEKHLCLVNKKYKFQCKKCKGQFDTIIMLKCHLKNCRMVQDCMNCKKQNPRSLLRGSYAKARSHQCLNCDESFGHQNDAVINSEATHELKIEEKKNIPDDILQGKNVVLSHVQDEVNSNETDKNMNYGCGYCGEIYKSKTDLYEHFEEDNHICEFCKKTFESCEKLVSHHTLSHKESKMSKEPNGADKTDKCSRYKFKNRVSSFTCSICFSSFKLDSEYNSHLLTHIYRDGNEHTEKFQNSVSPFTCSICRSSFSLESEYSSHLFTHISMDDSERTKKFQNSVSSFTCSICLSSFSLENEYNSHLITHMSMDDSDDGKFQNSVKKLETQDWNYNCKVCCSTFKSKMEFEIHLLLHSVSSLEPISDVDIKTCKLCQKTYVDNMESHYCVNRKDRYQCIACKKSFQTQLMLQCHAKAYKTVKRECISCKYIFYKDCQVVNHKCLAFKYKTNKKIPNPIYDIPVNNKKEKKRKSMTTKETRIPLKNFEGNLQEKTKRIPNKVEIEILDPEPKYIDFEPMRKRICKISNVNTVNEIEFCRISNEMDQSETVVLRHTRKLKKRILLSDNCDPLANIDTKKTDLSSQTTVRITNRCDPLLSNNNKSDISNQNIDTLANNSTSFENIETNTEISGQISDKLTNVCDQLKNKSVNSNQNDRITKNCEPLVKNETNTEICSQIPDSLTNICDQIADKTDYTNQNERITDNCEPLENIETKTDISNQNDRLTKNCEPLENIETKTDISNQNDRLTKNCEPLENIENKTDISNQNDRLTKNCGLLENIETKTDISNQNDRMTKNCEPLENIVTKTDISNQNDRLTKNCEPLENIETKTDISNQNDRITNNCEPLENTETKTDVSNQNDRMTKNSEPLENIETKTEISNQNDRITNNCEPLENIETKTDISNQNERITKNCEQLKNIETKKDNSNQNDRLTNNDPLGNNKSKTKRKVEKYRLVCIVKKNRV